MSYVRTPRNTDTDAPEHPSLRQDTKRSTLRAVAGPHTLKLEEYFLGKTTAYGVFEDRFNKLRRSFVVDITGEVIDDQLTLTEHFLYNDGEQETRVWNIDILGNGRYRGVADKVHGEAMGEAIDNVFHWKYKFALQVNGANWKVGFDDYMYLLDDDVMINRADVSRFGVRLGTVTITYRK